MEQIIVFEKDSTDGAIYVSIKTTPIDLINCIRVLVEKFEVATGVPYNAILDDLREITEEK